MLYQPATPLATATNHSPVAAYVLVFLSTVCPCSDSHTEHLAQLARQYPQVQFLGVHSNQDENTAEGIRYFSQKNLPFPVIRDEKSALAQELGAYKTPQVYLFSASGKLLYSGAITDRSDLKLAQQFYLQDAIQQVLSGHGPDLQLTKVNGCEIQRN